MSKSDDTHQRKLERQEANRRRRERIDKLRRERDLELRSVWERHQERIRKATGAA
jgi:hypothetical protein